MGGIFCTHGKYNFVCSCVGFVLFVLLTRLLILMVDCGTTCRGLAGNILCFFISGLPGMIDYFLLALYKDRLISSLTEKRINLSINVWLRSPGIVTFCCLVTTCWLQPAMGTHAKDLMPWYGFLPAMLVVYYNGQYYGMRVVGNYYIRITQDEYAKIPNVKLPRTKVELHAS